ncbi:hypothetical protein CN930_12825 [Bacillus cereus]|nr:hypothetical protein CON40_26625 [Bacillus cereus]PGL38881.1 hypothetical protein CN930_12825 [Bacillus cereus]
MDDLRECPEGFVVARTMEEAIVYLKEYDVKILSLDHDVGDDKEGNLLMMGYDLVKFICENGIRAYLHSDNGIGRENMYQTLKAD